MPPFPEEEDPGAVRPPLVLRESGLPPGVVLPVDESPAEEVSEGWVPVDGVVSYSSPQFGSGSVIHLHTPYVS